MSKLFFLRFFLMPIIPIIPNLLVKLLFFQVGDEPPPTPNDPFLQQLAELSNHEQQQPSTTTISFHGNNAPPQQQTPWQPPPSEDLIVPSFTSYDSEAAPLAPPPAQPQPQAPPAPQAPSGGNFISNPYIKVFPSNREIFLL